MGGFGHLCIAVGTHFLAIALGVAFGDALGDAFADGFGVGAAA
jgi:hypothetical protein